MKDHEAFPVIPIKKGHGVWLEDFDGNQYLDAISSWWVNLFGHANPVINAALKDQLDTLEHVIFAGFTHESAIKLAEKLVEITPAGLNRCFYADNGSSAVEVALKMSFHYWRNKGQTQKTKFITLENSYHGETLGALAVGNVALYKETYGPLLMDVITVPGPDCYNREPGESWFDYSTRRFALMEQMLQQHAETVCAVIIEPLVQCAGNMRMYDPVYLHKLRDACDKYNVHLIADEIAVGFGRTGTLFACEQAAITPDFMCLSKGLTGGYLPLSAVLTTDQVYQAFYDDYQNMTAFLHSHSYTGNALACRAGLATIKIFQQQDIIESNKKLATVMAKAAARFNEHPHVAEVRQTGMILAIEMVKNKQTREPFPWQERRGLKVYQYALSKGVLLRPLGNVIYFMPPYVVTEEELWLIADVAWEGIQRAVKD
jgi:adenosylmethionine-8-amino-7-oxononanoate aminotransferase